ncbi:hypothetical protein D3C73_621410 [compost metagenome]
MNDVVGTCVTCLAEIREADPTYYEAKGITSIYNNGIHDILSQCNYVYDLYRISGYRIRAESFAIAVGGDGFGSNGISI